MTIIKLDRFGATLNDREYADKSGGFYFYPRNLPNLRTSVPSSGVSSSSRC